MRASASSAGRREGGPRESGRRCRRAGRRADHQHRARQLRGHRAVRPRGPRGRHRARAAPERFHGTRPQQPREVPGHRRSLPAGGDARARRARPPRGRTPRGRREHVHLAHPRRRAADRRAEPRREPARARRRRASRSWPRMPAAATDAASTCTRSTDGSRSARWPRAMPTSNALRTVLVVDDSAFMRKIVVDLIDGSGEFRVVGTARHGADALKKVNALAPDVVTMDIEMPELDGLAALERIMRESPRPVVMLSGAATGGVNDPVLRALELGAVDFVRKPSGPISLDLATVREPLLAALRVGDRGELSRRGGVRRGAGDRPRGARGRHGGGRLVRRRDRQLHRWAALARRGDPVAAAVARCGGDRRAAHAGGIHAEPRRTAQRAQPAAGVGGARWRAAAPRPRVRGAGRAPSHGAHARRRADARAR